MTSFIFLQEGTVANRVILMALSTVWIILSLTTVTVTAGNSEGEIFMSVLIFVSELALIVILFPIHFHWRLTNESLSLFSYKMQGKSL